MVTCKTTTRPALQRTQRWTLGTVRTLQGTPGSPRAIASREPVSGAVPPYRKLAALACERRCTGPRLRPSNAIHCSALLDNACGSMGRRRWWWGLCSSRYCCAILQEVLDTLFFWSGSHPQHAGFVNWATVSVHTQTPFLIANIYALCLIRGKSHVSALARQEVPIPFV